MSLVNIEHDSDGAVRIIEINRPEKYNALGPDLISQLSASIREAIEETSVRVIHLRGAGKSFCAGGDMKWMALMDPDTSDIDPDVLYDLLNLVSQSQKPVTAYVHGRMFGGGVGLVAACDLVVADSGATFCLPELKHGLVPAMIYPFLARRLSRQVIRELTLSARVITAQEAVENLLIDTMESRDSAEVVSTIKTWHTALIAAAPVATAFAKQLFTKHPTLKDDDSRDYVLSEIDRARRADEAQARILAFFSKNL